MVAVCGVRGHRADLGGGLDLHGLPLVVDVGMDGDLDALVQQALESHDLLSGEGRGVERELHFDRAEGGYGRELPPGCHLSPVDLEGASPWPCP